MVRAKFVVNSIERIQSSVPRPDGNGGTVWGPGEVHTVKLSPVYGNGDPDHENTRFWHASPNGEIRLGCANTEAAGRFELGREYYVDFTPADEAISLSGDAGGVGGASAG